MEAVGRPRAGSGALLVPAISGVVLLVAMFALTWFGASEAVARGFEEGREIQQQFGGPEVVIPDVSDNGWDGPGDIDLYLVDVPIALVLLAAGLCGVALTLVRMSPRPPVSRFGAAGVTTALGTLATAVVLYYLVNPPHDGSREIGVFVGLIAAGGVAVGGWIALEDEERRVSPPSVPRASGRSARRTRSRSSSG
jgi:hypothetical protein